MSSNMFRRLNGFQPGAIVGGISIVQSMTRNDVVKQDIFERKSYEDETEASWL